MIQQIEKNNEVVLIRGDGIGPEIADAVLFILESAGAKITWKEALAGKAATDKGDSPLPQRTIDAIKACGVALKGPLTTDIGLEDGKAKGFRSVNVELRKTLDLYANVRPVSSLPGVKARYSDVNLVVIRENTEGLYTGLEQEIVPGVVTSLKVSTRKACLRIAEFAFRFAEQNKRKKITGVHKANIMKLSDGLALDCYREVAAQHPTITYEEKIIDATAMSLVMNPSQFDVLVMENLYGDIISDLAAGLIGGLGLAPSGNIGERGAVFEAVHGSAPDIAGKGVANPSALLLSAVEMLRYLGQANTAELINVAFRHTLLEGHILTSDLGGTASTMDFAKAIVANLNG